MNNDTIFSRLKHMSMKMHSLEIKFYLSIFNIPKMGPFQFFFIMHIVVSILKLGGYMAIGSTIC
jgi:hypothetical protein